MSSNNTLSDSCVLYNLSNLVVGPTCFKGDKLSAVDVLLSTEPKRFKCAINTSCSLSDFHNFTCVATKLHKSYVSPKTIFYRSYKKFDDQTFIDDVKNIPFSVCDIFDDEDDYGVSENYYLALLIATLLLKMKFLRSPLYHT